MKKQYFIICLLCASLPSFVIAQQYGIGLLPSVGTYYFDRKGFDTMGYAQGKLPVSLSSYKKRYTLAAVPTFIKRYQDGKRMIDFGVSGGYKNETLLLPNYIYPVPRNFYHATSINKNITLFSTVHARLLSSKNERFALWLGLSRGVYWEQNEYKEISGYQTLNHRKELQYGVQFKVVPAIQFRATRKLFFYLKYNNPSSVDIGNRVKTYYLPDSESLRHYNHINIHAFYPKFTDNVQLGVRYYFKSTQKQEELVDVKEKPKKRPILSKTYWGIGAGMSVLKNNYWFISFIQPDVNFSRYSYFRNWYISPTINLYRISNFGKKYQEFNLSNFYYDKYDFIPHLSIDQKKQIVIEDSRPGIMKMYSFSMGYAHYKRINRLSKGFFNLYYGTNVDYTHFTYNATPGDKGGFKQVQHNNGLRVSMSMASLFQISEKWNLEAKWLPHYFIEANHEYTKSDSPLYQNNGKRYLNLSNYKLSPNFQIGAKYAFKIINPNKKKKKY